MEAELGEALAEVQLLLEADPDNPEVQQVYNDLLEAIEASKHGGDEEPDSGGGDGPGEDDPVATAEAQLGDDDRPVALPEHCGDPSKMYLDRGEEPQRRKGAGNNAHIHPSSVYAAAKPSFAALAQHYPGLSPHVKVAQGGQASLDFKSYAATRELTRCLLHNDHQLDWWIPHGQLIPPVTNRLNYIHWLKDLLKLSSPPAEAATGEGSSTVRGLDIGCGANCIYPLIGAATCGWQFVGTDITPEALTWARRNVAANPQLSHLIEVRQVAAADKQTPGGMLLGAVGEGETFHFSMCNPPFFDTLADANQNPNTACGGTPAEMVCLGGEEAFVRAMVEESATLGSQVHWYTSMVGKKSTLKEVRRLLHDRSVPVIRSTQFFQGETSRWAVAWSYAADPKTSAVPLERAPAAARHQMGGSARRFISFQIKAKRRGTTPAMFSELSTFFAARGTTCSPDALMSKMRITWTPSAPGSQAAKRHKSGSPMQDGSAPSAYGGVVSFNCMVYEDTDTPRCVKVTGSMESPSASADEDGQAAHAFNCIFQDAQAHLQATFGE